MHFFTWRDAVRLFILRGWSDEEGHLSHLTFPYLYNPNNCLKSLATISLILIMLYSQVGYYFVMQSSQHSIKASMREKVLGQLKNSEMEVIVLADHLKNISWEEDGKEFSLDGEMYDLVKKVKVNGQVLLYCINDVKEKELVDKYNEITNHNSSDKKEKTNIDNSINLFVNSVSENRIFYTMHNNNIFASFASRLQSTTLQIFAPPPES